MRSHDTFLSSSLRHILIYFNIYKLVKIMKVSVFKGHQVGLWILYTSVDNVSLYVQADLCDNWGSTSKKTILSTEARLYNGTLPESSCHYIVNIPYINRYSFLNEWESPNPSAKILRIIIIVLPQNLFLCSNGFSFSYLL